MTSRVGLLGTLLLALPAMAPAQEVQEPPRRQQVQEPPPGQQTAQTQTRRCRQVLESDVRRIFNARGHELIYFRDPVRVLCTGGLTLEADSAVMNRTTSTIELVGDVFYQDTIRSLTADWANYIGERSQLFARGSVVLRNLEDGSVIEGDELDYLQASATREVARMTVRGDRPYARIPPQPDSTGAVPDTAETTEVWADRMEFEGEEVFRGIGNVELRRGDMSGAGRMVVFDQRQDQMTLSGDAFFRTDRYRLEGDQIDAFLAGDAIRTVTAVRLARVVSDELTVESERIRIGFVDGRLDRMEAWNPQPDSVPRALADAQDFRLRADSIDARADSVGIREVRAVGQAYGERDAAPSAEGAAAGAGIVDAVSRDWIQGDTILGFFERRGRGGGPERGGRPERLRPGAPDDTAAVRGLEEPERAGTDPADSVETVLERIVVIGGRTPALSLYRMQAEEPGQPPSINFLKAEMITLHMEEGDVTRVDADGPLDGVYLSPAARREEGGGTEPPEAAGGEGGAP